MEYIKSKDGTQIAYEKIGSGKPLIIIGGSLADHQMYVPLASALTKKLTVFNYDRRNRGKSGTSANHTIKTELDDLKAIISLCNEAPILYGHSAGAALAIRAAANGLSISELILSDLPYSLSSDDNKHEAKRFEEERKTIKEFLTIGDKVGAVKFFLKDFGMEEQELNAFVASENGAQAVVNSVTLPVDYDLLGNGLTPIELLRKVQVPTLILTSDYGWAVAEDAAKYLPHSKMAVLEGPTYNLATEKITKPIFKFMEQTL